MAGLILLGLFIGTLGTLIGVGGGFILMPVLIFLYPDQNPEFLTSISLAVVFFNSLSGSFAYARMGKIDYKSSLLFSMTTVPGAILGAFTTAYIPRRLFNIVFGVLMILASVFLAFNREKKAGKGPPAGKTIFRQIIDRDGNNYNYSFNPALGMQFGFFVGYLSSLLGIGGGIIHVPLLIYCLNFPVHIATATSHFILVIVALTGTIVHIARGAFVHGAQMTAAISLGVVIGAQLGAGLSRRVQGKWIVLCLAMALAMVGLRIIFTK
ncbi:MAG: sulfite exporter TauE/SafE family protein [Candidatus Wallbacteria bacterium]|nr:sulfite exporter TauE/SafE family protein [Candidatus Wallbacteria bacterium]